MPPDVAAQLAELDTATTVALPPEALDAARTHGQNCLADAVRICLAEINHTLTQAW